MKQYLGLLKHVMQDGNDRSDRTGVGTRGVFGAQVRFDLSDGFPLLTTKSSFEVNYLRITLVLKGDTNIKYLNENGVTIWDEWADENGDLGPIYGKQWTAWEGKDGVKINQIQEAVDMLKNDPYSRRIIVSGWNVSDISSLIKGKKTAPPPCHSLFQFYVSNNKLSCQLYQRSADLFLGVPFNIASYSLLTMMFAQVCNLGLGEFVHTFGDLHIYKNHFEQVKLQLGREPRKLPEMKINPQVKNIFEFKYEDFELIGYNPHPGIKAPIAV